MVNQMIQRGTDIIKQAIDQYKPIRLLSCYSGGNDSIVSTHFAMTHFGGFVVHCNTGIGIDKTREHVRSTCNKFGWELIEKQAPPYNKPKGFDESKLPTGKWIEGCTPYETFVLNFGFPGPGQHSRMFQRLKERSIDAVIRESKVGKSRFSTVLLISGIRQDESAIRAGYKRAIQKVDSQIWVNPFYFETAELFELYRQEFGLPRNPVSTQIGISGECLCGAFAKPGEKELIRKVEPKTAEYIDNLERRANELGFNWCWGQRPTKKDKEEVGEEFRPMCVGCIRRQIG